MDLSPILISNDSFDVRVVRTNNRHAYARVKGRSVVISIPARLGDSQGYEMAKGLYSKISGSMARHPERYVNDIKRVNFSDGQSFSILGNGISIRVVEAGSRNACGRISNGILEVTVPGHYSEEERKDAISIVSRKTITKFALPQLHSMLDGINRAHFNSNVGNLRMALASSRWGSCVTSNGSARIMLNFKLLFMPPECMEYVMVHELAHTKVRGHTKRFWSIVERILPDYRKRRRMLRNS